MPTPGGVFEQLVRGEPVAHAIDMANSDTYRTGAAPLRQAFVDIAGAQTGLLVPLRKDGALLGAIQFYRRETGPFAEKQIALLQNFAAQAVIAMENARLLTETREALEQQTATAEVLQVINSSPGHLAPVFDVMLDKALDLCGAAFGTLWTRDGECFRPVALRRVPAAFAELLSKVAYSPEPGSQHERLLRGAPYAEIEDVAAEASIGPVRRALVELGGARTIIAVPLHKDGSVVGVISAYRQEVRPFTDKQIALLQNFAAQVVIAMENARLLTETREALEQQTATAEVLGVINSLPGDLAPVFDAILDRALRLCGAAHGHVFTVEGELGRAVAARGDPEFVEWMLQWGPLRPPPGSAMDRMMRGEDVVQIPDSTDTENYRTGTAIRELIDRSGVRTTLGLALRSESALLGAIFVNRREVRPFTDKQIALLQNFAAQAVIAMENARLITETREALEQQTATAEVLQVINSSAGNLAPVFDALLDKALILCEAAFGILWIRDGDAFSFATQRGLANELEVALRNFGPLEPHEGTVFRRLLDGNATVQHRDIAAEVYSRATQQRHLLLKESGGARTMLCAALRKDNLLQGVVVIYRQEVRPFSDRQIALLENFAAQAAIAMENARLITETREALAQQTATAEVLQVINSSPGDLAPVFDAILEKAHRLCGAAYGALVLYNGEYFCAVRVRGYPEHVAESVRRPFRGSVFHEELIRGERYVHIPDVIAVASQLSRTPGQAMTAAGFRTTLMVPLRKDGKLLGHISASRLEVHPFSEKEIALLENFAAQAVIAMENARLLTETRDALEQQTATAEVLQVINSSPGDLAPVFGAMLDKAMALCEGSSATLYTIEAEHARTVAVRGASVVPEWMQQQDTFDPPPGSSIDRLRRGERFVHMFDATETEAYRDSPLYREMIDISGCRSSIAVALRKDDTVLGVIAIYRQEVRPFSDKQISLLENFAAQAVIAMENARLLGELRERTRDLQESLEYQTATSDVLKVISRSGAELEPMLRTLVETSLRICDADRGAISLAHPDGLYRPTAPVGFGQEYKDLISDTAFAPEPGSVTGRVASEKQIVHIADVLHDPQFTALEHQRLGDFRTVLGVPLLRDDKVIGVLGVFRVRVEPFTEKQIALFQVFADQAVIAIENARLITETREALEQQTATAEVLQVINSSPGDLAPVFDAMLEKATTLCDAAHGNLWI